MKNWKSELHTDLKAQCHKHLLLFFNQLECFQQQLPFHL